ncbi:MAG TPA: hypothetical protein VKH41_09520, partial [Myxococcota bacterium]|nr:hypothetical protein [Myxococcota bacterium]
MGRPRRPVKRRARAPRAAGLDAERVVGALAGGGRRGQTAARLLRRLGAGRHELRALRRILRQLQDAGRIERVDGVWRLPRADGLLDAELVETRRARDEHGREYRLEDAAGAKPGDRVLIAPLAGGRAELLQVVDGERDHWVGILHGHGKLLGISPYRDEGDWWIRVSRGDARGAAVGEVVRAVPVERGSRRRAQREGPPWARVVERLGRPGDPDADFAAIVWRHQLPVAFPPDALAQAEA